MADSQGQSLALSFSYNTLQSVEMVRLRPEAEATCFLIARMRGHTVRVLLGSRGKSGGNLTVSALGRGNPAHLFLDPGRDSLVSGAFKRLRRISGMSQGLNLAFVLSHTTSKPLS